MLQNIPLSESIGIRLSVAELEAYAKRSWTGPYPLLDAAQVKRLTESFLRRSEEFLMPKAITPATAADAFQKQPWFKSVHAYLPEFYDVATHPMIVNRVRCILGDDVLLWGSGPVAKLPGDKHRWHVDVEHQHWDGVSVFVGLHGMSADASLKILEGSHLSAQGPEGAAAVDDQQAAAASRQHGGSGVITEVDMREGSFFIFAGRAWHGSHNRSATPRLSLILQYARPDAKIRVPLSFKKPVQWHSHAPPCVLVSGVDRYHLNTLVGRPRLS